MVTGNGNLLHFKSISRRRREADFTYPTKTPVLLSGPAYVVSGPRFVVIGLI